MRRILAALLLLATAAVLALVALPLVLPTSFIKGQVERLASAALGRALTIDGDFSLVLWPPFGLRATQVRLAGPPGGDAPLLAVDELDLAIDARAWLDGTLAIDRLHLTHPVVQLRVRADGSPSWRLASGDAGGSGNGSPPPRIAIGALWISDGLIAYRDDLAGTDRRLERIALDVTGRGEAEGLDIRASFALDGRTAELSGSIADPNALLAGGETPIDLALRTEGATASIAGMVDSGAESARLDLDLEVDDAGLQVASAGSVATPTASPPPAARFIRITGRLALRLAGRGAERTRIDGRLDLGAIDLDAILPPRPADDGSPERSADAAGWSDEPLPLPLSLPVDVELVVTFDSVRAGEVEVGAGTVHLVADGATARAELTGLALYDGRATAVATLALDDPPRLGLEVEALDLRLRPLVQTMAGIDRLEGRGALTTRLASTGGTPKALVAALRGDGVVVLRDGAILGINIGAMLRDIAALGFLTESEAARRTDFTELRGSFTVADGVLSNNDLFMRAPLLRMTGSGRVDLTARTVDYRLLPQLASTIEGQDAAMEPNFQAGVSIVVQGPWSDPTLQLQIGDRLTGDLARPGALVDTIEGLADRSEQWEFFKQQLGLNRADNPVGALLQGLFGGGAADKPEKPVWQR